MRRISEFEMVDHSFSNSLQSTAANYELDWDIISGETLHL
jgi:hypothetical protein